jgi:hypothetical protein
MNQKGLPVYTGEEWEESRMDKIELIRKGREQYEMLIVTRHVQGEEHFIGIFSSYEEMQKKVNPFIFKYGTICVWQMNSGEQLGEGIFGHDMAASGCDYIVSENGKRVDV